MSRALRVPVGSFACWLLTLVPGLAQGGSQQPAQSTRAKEELPAGALARLGTTRFQNFGRTWSVCFAPDGKTVAAGTWDGLVIVWDVATGRIRHQLTVSRGPTKSVVFSPDGKVLAAGGGDSVIRLWDLASAKTLLQMTANSRAVSALAFTPDGRSLASESGDGTICLWDLTTGKAVRTFGKNNVPSSKIVFSPDGKMLAGVGPWTGRQGFIYLWDTLTGKELRKIPGYPWRNLAQFSPDGKLLVAGGRFSQSLQFWNPATGKDFPALKIEQADVTALAFSADGKTLAGTRGDGFIFLWEVATCADRLRLANVDRGDIDITLSPDGTLLATTSVDRSLLLWDATGLRHMDAAEPGHLTPEDLQRLWADLAGSDAAKAHRAIWQMALAPNESVPFVKRHLHPVRAEAPERIAQLVRELDDKRFAIRKRAMTELEKMGDLAEPSLRRVIEANPSLEHRQRVEQLLLKLETLSPEALRVARTFEVLDHCNSAEAQQLHQALAGGAPGARSTREAKKVLERLARK
jgi:WD40 repeat protein